MNNKVIITISRQFGSGGSHIGKSLSEDLGIAFYDKSLIQLAAEESGVAADLFKNADEHPVSGFWNTFASNANVFGNQLTSFSDMSMNDKLFIIQSNVIKKVSEESCVIVGRCADYVLRDKHNAIHVFIHARMEDRLNRLINSYGLPNDHAKDIMHKTDKRRASYYNYYTDKKWGNAENYDLSLSSSSAGPDGCVSLIKEFIKLKFDKA